MTVLLSAVIAVLAAQTALAEQRANKPFNTTNGHTSAAAPVAPRVITITTPGGGATANGPATATKSMLGGAPSGGGRQVGSRATTGSAVRHGGKAFWSGSGRKADGGSTPGTEELPPNYTKPGALIRTTGQQPKYEIPPEPGTNKPATGTHTTDAGEIVMNKNKAFDIGRAPSVQIGPKDTLPPPNPGTFSRTTTGGAAANTGSGSSGTGGGHDNNGSGNNGSGNSGDDYDQHGGDRAKDKSFNDAF